MKDISNEEYNFRIENYHLLSESKVLILGKHHLNFPAREDSIENLGLTSFNACLVLPSQLHQADLIIYADAEGNKVIKSRFTTNQLLNVMKYLGFSSFTR